MIDIFHEQLISLTDAAELFPRRRGGRKVHPATLYRYTTAGYHGVVLESVQVCGTRCTSKESVARFFERLTEIALARRASAPPTRHRQVQVDKKLDMLGI